MADALGHGGAGPLRKTRQPPDYERRIAVMQAYLSHDDYRILSDAAGRLRGRHADAGPDPAARPAPGTIPFTVIQMTDGTWIINQVDLAAAGNPARPCDPSAKDTASTRSP